MLGLFGNGALKIGKATFDEAREKGLKPVDIQLAIQNALNRIYEGEETPKLAQSNPGKTKDIEIPKELIKRVAKTRGLSLDQMSGVAEHAVAQAIEEYRGKKYGLNQKTGTDGASKNAEKPKSAKPRGVHGVAGKLTQR